MRTRVVDILAPAELEEKFWKSLKSDMTMMLGLQGVDDGHTRPMTAQLDEEAAGPIWFFTALNAQPMKTAHQVSPQSLLS